MNHNDITWNAKGRQIVMRLWRAWFFRCCLPELDKVCERHSLLHSTSVSIWNRMQDTFHTKETPIQRGCTQSSNELNHHGKNKEVDTATRILVSDLCPFFDLQHNGDPFPAAQQITIQVWRRPFTRIWTAIHPCCFRKSEQLMMPAKFAE
jgi:hypothetical protein